MAECPALREAGFSGGKGVTAPVQAAADEDFWSRSQPGLRAAIDALAVRLGALVAKLSEDQLLQLDHLICVQGSIPAYAGGRSGLRAVN